MVDDAADALQADLARHLHVVGVGHEQVFAATAVGEYAVHRRQRIVVQRIDAFLAAFPQRNVGVAAGSRNAHERLGHEAGDQVVLARDLGADLAVGGQPVRGA